MIDLEEDWMQIQRESQNPFEYALQHGAQCQAALSTNKVPEDPKQREGLQPAIQRPGISDPTEPHTPAPHKQQAHLSIASRLPQPQHKPVPQLMSAQRMPAVQKADSQIPMSKQQPVGPQQRSGSLRPLSEESQLQKPAAQQLIPGVQKAESQMPMSKEQPVGPQQRSGSPSPLSDKSQLQKPATQQLMPADQEAESQMSMSKEQPVDPEQRSGSPRPLSDELRLQKPVAQQLMPVSGRPNWFFSHKSLLVFGFVCQTVIMGLMFLVLLARLEALSQAVAKTAVESADVASCGDKLAGASFKEDTSAYPLDRLSLATIVEDVSRSLLQLYDAQLIAKEDMLEAHEGSNRNSMDRESKSSDRDSSANSFYLVDRDRKANNSCLVQQQSVAFDTEALAVDEETEDQATDVKSACELSLSSRLHVFRQVIMDDSSWAERWRQISSWWKYHMHSQFKSNLWTVLMAFLKRRHHAVKELILKLRQL